MKFVPYQLASIALVELAGASSQNVHTVKLRNPQPFQNSRFENLSKNVTRIEYQDIKGMSLKLETKLTKPDQKKLKKMGKLPLSSKIESEDWKYLEQGSTISPITLSNDMNFAYFGPIYMGSQQQQLENVLFDTGSGWLAITTTDCYDDGWCNTPGYNYTDSTLYQAISNTTQTMETLTTYFVGHEAIDQACFDTNAANCVTDFVWFNAYYGSVDADGILGLMPNPYYYGTPPLLMSFLYDEGIIDSKLFSFALRGYNDPAGSFLDVGFYDNSAMANPGAMSYVDVSEGQGFWAAYLTGIRIRPQVTDKVSYKKSLSVSEEFYLGGYVTAITSTSLACMSLPYGIAYFAQSWLTASMQYESVSNNGFAYFQCADIPNLPVLDFLFGGYWLEASVDDFVVNLDGTNCAICIEPLSSYYKAYMGTAFLRNFYTIYDMQNLRMGFASLAGSTYTKPDPVAGTDPKNYYYDFTGFKKLAYISPLLVVGFSMSGLGIIGLVSAALYFYVIKADQLDAPPSQTPPPATGGESSGNPTPKPPVPSSEITPSVGLLLQKLLDSQQANTMN